MAQLVPFTVSFPAISVSNNAVRIPTTVHMIVTGVTGNLQALTLGPFTINVRDHNGVLIKAVVWNSNGEIREVVDSFDIPDYGSLRFDIAGIGVGAAGPSLVVWCVID